MEPTPQMWWQALDETADWLLDAAGILAPPVDALKIATTLQVQVAYDAHQSGRGRHVRLGGRTSILIRPDERPERMQWAIAHELGEFAAYRVFDRLDLIPEESGPRSREAVANQLAARILLPTRWFFRDARDLDADLWKLKRLYRTASYESMAWRLLAGSEPTVVTICDQGKISARRGNLESAPPPLTPLERDVWQSLQRSPESPLERRDQGLCVQGWPIIEPGWRREVLRLTHQSHQD